jgi:membrane associated rhomboid family serine protease
MRRRAHLPTADPGRRQRVHHDGSFHHFFTSHPGLAWTVVGLLVVFVLLSSVGKLLGRVFEGTPWWARIGLVGAVVYAWRKHRTDPIDRRQETPFR